MKISDKLIKWISEPNHLLVDQFFVEEGITQEERVEMEGKDSELRKAVALAMEVQKVNIINGALSDRLDKHVALRILEEQHGWKAKDKGMTNNTLVAIFGEERFKALGERIREYSSRRGIPVDG